MPMVADSPLKESIASRLLSAVLILWGVGIDLGMLFAQPLYRMVATQAALDDVNLYENYYFAMSGVARALSGFFPYQPAIQCAGITSWLLEIGMNLQKPSVPMQAMIIFSMIAALMIARLIVNVRATM